MKRAPRSGSNPRIGFRKLKSDLEATLPALSKHQTEELRSVVVRFYKKKFRKSGPPKYGALNKGFTEHELQAFFRAVDNPKFHLLFSYQAQLGLRIGEAVRLNLSNIKFESRELVLKTEKAARLDVLLIPSPLFKETLDYITANSDKIEKAHGSLFFKEDGKSSTSAAFIDEGYARHKFREYVQLALIDEIYCTTDESVPDRRARSLHRLTTHSLRHYAITHFAEQTNGNVFLTSKFARHCKPDVTMTYISTNKKALYDGIDGAFSVSQAVALKAKVSKPV